MLNIFLCATCHVYFVFSYIPIFHFLIKLKAFKNWFERQKLRMRSRQGERVFPSMTSLLKWSQWLRPGYAKVRSQKFSSNLSAGGRNFIMGAIIAVSQQEAGNKTLGWVSNPDSPLWDMGFLSGYTPTARFFMLNFHFFSILQILVLC